MKILLPINININEKFLYENKLLINFELNFYKAEVLCIEQNMRYELQMSSLFKLPLHFLLSN